MAEIDEIQIHLEALERITGLTGSDGKDYDTNMHYDKESQGQSEKSVNSNLVDPLGRDPKDMTGKNSKKIKKAGDEEEEESEEGMEHDEKGEKLPMLAKKAKDEDDENGKDAKIVVLTAQVKAQSDVIRKLVNQNTMITAKPDSGEAEDDGKKNEDQATLEEQQALQRRLVGMILNFCKGLAMHLRRNGKIGDVKIQEEKMNMLAQMMDRESSGIYLGGGKGYSGKN